MTQELISTNQTLKELTSLWEELSVLEAAYTTQRVCFFEAIGKQGAATEALNDGTSVVLVLGSNRSGKTVWGVNEAIAHSLGYRPWLPESHPQRIVRLANGEPIPVPNIGRIIAQNYQQAIQQTIFPKLQEWAPAGWYKVKRDNRGIPTEIRWKNGSIIYLMSNDQDDMAFEGTNGHWAWADEPIDYKKYVGLKRGLVDFSGHMWMTMTPLTQPWIHDIIVSRANDADGRVKLFKFSVWDNCVENGGHLHREDIEEFLSDLREDELEARLHGNFLHLAGRIYKEWEPESPYWVNEFTIPEAWPRVCVIDPHPRKPIAVLWAAVSPDEQIIVYRDLFNPRLKTVKDVADKMKELEGWSWSKSKEQWVRGEDAEPVSFRVIDTSAKQDERTSGDNIWKRFASEGIYTQMAKKRNAEAGYDAIHEALKMKYDWDEPGLIVFNTCAHVKQNFLNFCWDDWASSKQRELKGDKQDVRKNHDDFIDCIRYIYQTSLTYKLLRREAKRASRDKDEKYNGIDLMSGRKNPWPTCSESHNRHESRLRGTALISTTNHSLRRRNRIPFMRETE
jgi:hypothetical protein